MERQDKLTKIALFSPPRAATKTVQQRENIPPSPRRMNN